MRFVGRISWWEGLLGPVTPCVLYRSEGVTGSHLERSPGGEECGWFGRSLRDRVGALFLTSLKRERERVRGDTDDWWTPRNDDTGPSDGPSFLKGGRVKKMA